MVIDSKNIEIPHPIYDTIERAGDSTAETLKC